MLTRRDMLRAQAHVRRRLVAAFVTGSPEVDATRPRPLRSVLTGMVVSALVLAGCWVASQMRSRPPTGWFTRDTVVIEAETGQLHLVRSVDGRLQLTPVPNLTSARLVSGSAQLRTVVVGQRWIRAEPRTVGLGIDGAPAVVSPITATTSTAHEPGWTACLRPGTAGPPAAVAAVALDPPGGVALSHGSWALSATDTAGTLWLVLDHPHGSRRHRVPERLHALPGLLGLETAAVPSQWLDLVPRGADLRVPTGLERSGTAPDVSAGPAAGDLIATPEGFGRLTRAGAVPLGAFEALVHRAATGREPILVTGPVVWLRPAVRASPWPERLPSPMPAGAIPCWEAEPSSSTRIALRSGAAAGGWPTSEVPGAPAAPEPTAGSEATSGFRVVPDPAWLLARGATPEELAPLGAAEVVVLVEEGRCYPLLGPDTLAALGLRLEDFPPVPASWQWLVSDCQVVSVARARGDVGTPR